MQAHGTTAVHQNEQTRNIQNAFCYHSSSWRGPVNLTAPEQDNQIIQPKTYERETHGITAAHQNQQTSNTNNTFYHSSSSWRGSVNMTASQQDNQMVQSKTHQMETYEITVGHQNQQAKNTNNALCHPASTSREPVNSTIPKKDSQMIQSKTHQKEKEEYEIQTPRIKVEPQNQFTDDTNDFQNHTTNIDTSFTYRKYISETRQQRTELFRSLKREPPFSVPSSDIQESQEEEEERVLECDLWK